MALNAHGLREEHPPDGVGGLVGARRGVEGGCRGAQSRCDPRFLGRDAAHLGRHPFETVPVEGGQVGCRFRGQVGWFRVRSGRSRYQVGGVSRCRSGRTGQHGHRLVAIRMGRTRGGHEERRRDPRERLGIQPKPG